MATARAAVKTKRAKVNTVLRISFSHYLLLFAALLEPVGNARRRQGYGSQRVVGRCFRSFIVLVAGAYSAQPPLLAAGCWRYSC